VRNLELFKREIEEEKFTPEDEKTLDERASSGRGLNRHPSGVGHGGMKVGHVPVLFKEAIDF